MKKMAIIIGSEGQDGRILFDFLLKRDYQLIGIGSGIARSHGLSWKKKVDITKEKEVQALIKKIKPDEVYYLAAFHHSAQDKVRDNLRLIEKSFAINFFPVAYFLEAIRRHSPQSKFFYAASSLIFGAQAKGKQNEKSSFNPDSFYGISKLAGLLMCRLYRQKYRVFASVGIFYNHESGFRPAKFISKKIIQGALDIKNKKKKFLKIGDLKASVDWGYAPDYVKAANEIVLCKNPDDFIVATGEKHSVLDFIKVVFSYLNLDWRKHVVEDKNMVLRKRGAALGDAGKLHRVTGWKPSVSFEEMIVKIIKELE